MTDPLPRLSAALADRYRIERELGQGGMATVYLAEDLKHHRKVAIKVLKPELAAVLGAERFVQEITTTAALQHPHILPLFDSGTADGFLYYVMPFIDGETLRSKLDRETQLGVDEAVGITVNVADALDYAHRQGVVHRDIKPENILLHEGRPMVADFGIALAVSAAAGGRMTETGLSLGTPHYMSPEQATAEKEITPRSDIYSLGSVLYEMLAGDPPHSGGSAQQIIMKIVTEEAAPVTRMRKAVPPNVAAAIAKSLEKLPADRFETARAFAEALTNPHFATATSPAANATGRSSRWKAALVAGLALGAIAGGLVGALWNSGGARPGERSREQLTFDGQSSDPAISPDGDFVASVKTSCEHSGEALCRSSLELQEVGSTQSRTLLDSADFLSRPVWSADGQTIVVQGALGAGRHGLFAVSRLTGTAQPVFLGDVEAWDTHAIGDSVLVVVGNDTEQRALIIATGTGAVTDSLRLPSFSTRFAVATVSWSPDGRHVAGYDGTSLWVADRQGRLTGSLRTVARRYIRWTPDGRHLVYFQTGASREDRLVRVAVGKDGAVRGEPEILLNRVPTLYTGALDVSRRSGRVAVATGDAITDLWSFDLAARPVTAHRETNGTTWYAGPALSPDGRAIYYYRGDALGDNIYVRDLATGHEEALTTVASPGGTDPILSPDGRRLVFYRVVDGANQSQYVEFPSRRVANVPIGPGAYAFPLGPSDFLVGRSDTLVRVDSLGNYLGSVAVPDSQSVARVATSRDGTRLVLLAFPTGPRGWAIVSTTIGDSTVRIVGSLSRTEPMPSVSWEEGDVITLGRWLDTDPRPSVWRMSLRDGAMTRVVDLPAPCTPNTIQVAGGGTVAGCEVNDFRPDIWLFDLEGVTR